MSTLLAWRNLATDRMRFAVTLVGIVFSVVLMAIQSGLLYGFVVTTASLVDNTGADIWIAARGARNVDQAVPFTERRRYQALATPGVAWARNHIVRFSELQRPDGGTETVIVVGFDTEANVGGPWRMDEGTLADLRLPDAVMIDRLYQRKLGVTERDQIVEVNDRRARVVGFTQGIRTFTQSPYLFASLRTARNLARLNEDQTTYVLVGVAEGHDRSAVRAALAEALPENVVFLAEDFSRSSSAYWLFSTGAGFSLIIAASLGLLVGIVVVAQTLYAATVDRLPEYATLRAMGAPRRYLYAIILKQALISAAFGYGIGIALAGYLVWSARNGSAALLMPLPMALGFGAITVAMCVGAALLSIRRVMTIDPVSVFK
jgi:putative ABC transport system permease protein